MRKFILILLFCFTITVNAQQIKWVDFETAIELQEQKPKKMLVFFYAEWSKDSHKMNETTLVNKDVAKYINKKFYAVNFNAEGNSVVNYKDFKYTNPNYDANRKGRNYQHFFADALKVTTYPSIVFFDEKADVISPVAGYKTPQELEIFLKMIATDDYKKVTTAQAWKNYQDNFKGDFSLN